MRSPGPRTRMVEAQLAERGIRDRRILDAFAAVPREDFVPEPARDASYEDAPLPIGEGQTISQPYVVALMAETLALRPHHRVLEVGTGSGYAAAILARLAASVYTVERIHALAVTARERLARMGVANVHVLESDGSLGWLEHAPYDAIAVAAAGPRVPWTLLSQLAVGGRLVMPVGPRDDQQLVRVSRRGEIGFREERLAGVSFVPLIGREAWR